MTQANYDYFERNYGYQSRIGPQLGNTEPGDGYKYRGRSFLQLTGKFNYRTYGQLIAVDLEAEPDRALDPSVASWILGRYFQRRGIPDMARRDDWEAVRRAVNGGLNGWDAFKAVVDALNGIGAPAPAPDPAPPAPDPAIAGLLARVVEVGRSRDGDPYVWGSTNHGGFDCSGFVQYCYLQIGLSLPRHSDAQWAACDETTEPLPGDLTVYLYDDPAQPGVTVPHLGLFISAESVLDARWGVGVGEHPHLATPRRYGRVRGLERLLERPEEPAPEPVAVTPASDQQAQIERLINSLAYLADDVLPKAATSRLKAERLAALREGQRVRVEALGAKGGG